MKKTVVLLLAAVMALSFAACAPKHGAEKVRVKCPACGYEFEAPHP